MTIQAGVPSAAHINKVFERYAACLSAGDIDGILALFAADAVFEDPIGTPPCRGREQIRTFFQDALRQTGGRILFRQEGAVRIRGRHAACAFIATCDRVSPGFVTETMDVVRFNDDGLIASLLAIWGESNARPLAGT